MPIGDAHTCGRPQVAVAALQPRVVRDVAGRLLEVRHQPAPLEDLGEQVRRLLAREVDAAELGDGVVAVLEEDAFVEVFGALEADGRVDGEVAGEVEIADEFVEEEAAQALVGARVAGEQRALHDLGQVRQREDRAVEIREVRPETIRFAVGERLRRVEHGTGDGSDGSLDRRACRTGVGANFGREFGGQRRRR